MTPKQRARRLRELAAEMRTVPDIERRGRILLECFSLGMWSEPPHRTARDKIIAALPEEIRKEYGL